MIEHNNPSATEGKWPTQYAEGDQQRSPGILSVIDQLNDPLIVIIAWFALKTNHRDFARAGSRVKLKIQQRQPRDIISIRVA